MRITSHQKRALEKITGKYWNSWHPEALEAYFAFTDRGKRTQLLNRVWCLQHPDNNFNEIEQSLWELMQCHVFHAVTVEMWKEDFRKGLLLLSDFLNDEKLPDAYIKHAFEVYETIAYKRYIPYCYCEHARTPERWKLKALTPS